MAELPLPLAIPRFKQNEDRMDRFMNGTALQTYVAADGSDVPTIRKFLSDKSVEIDSDAQVFFNDSIERIENAVDAAQSALQQIAASYDAFEPSIMRFAVGETAQSVDLDNAEIPAGFIRVFIDGVYQFSDTYTVNDGIIAPVGVWPGDGVRVNMEVLMDPSSSMSYSTPVDLSVATRKLQDDAVTPEKMRSSGDFKDLSFTAWTDGQRRKLSERARDVYNLADAPGAPDPTGNNASTSSLIAMLAEGVKCEIPQGDWVTEEELEIVKAGQVVEFLSSGGYGYGGDALPNWQPNTRLIAAGSFARRVRSRRLYRASSSDPQDAPTSAVINIQAEGVKLINPCVWLNCDYTDGSPTNYGDDVDIGIFVGTRVGVQIHDPQVLGYFREAGILFDVTGAPNLPRTLSKAGVPYPDGTVKHGGDGTHVWNPFILGSKWGIAVLGSLPKAGEAGYSTPYYDQQAGGTVTDERGRFGFSDFAVFGGRIYGTDHHSNRRRDDASGNYLTDTAGGSLVIDGLAGNASGMLQGMSFFKTRFASWEPYRIKLDRVNRAQFYGCHSEWRSAAFTKAGAPLAFDDSDTYGTISTTSRTKNTTLFGFSATLRPAFIADMSEVGNVESASSADVSSFRKGISTPGTLSSGGSVLSSTGEFDARAAVGYGARLRNGDVTILHIEPGGVHGTPTASAANVFVTAGDVLQRSTSAAKYKTDIQPLTDDALDRFLQMEGITYLSLCDGDDPDRRHSGVLADRAHELGLTDLVIYGAGGEVEGFAYERATAYLLEIIKRRLGASA